LFFKVFKDLFAACSHCRGSEEVRIIGGEIFTSSVL